MMPTLISRCSGGLRPSHAPIEFLDVGRPSRLPSRRDACSTPLNRAAFTLLELLVVVAIIGILMGLIIPSIGSIMQGTNIEQGARAVFDQISLARQIASTRNCTTELRLIKLAGVSSSGYSAMQIWVPGTNATMTPIAKVVNLPQSVVISGDAANLSAYRTQLETGYASGAWTRAN